MHKILQIYAESDSWVNKSAGSIVATTGMKFLISFVKIVRRPVAKKHNYEYILAEYIPTKKNVIVKKCLDENGFDLVTNYNNQNLKKINLRNYVKNGKVYIASVNKIKIPFVEVYE